MTSSASTPTAGMVKLKVGVVSLVRSSVLLTPVSEPATRSGVGASAISVSMSKTAGSVVGAIGSPPKLRALEIETLMSSMSTLASVTV